MEPCNSILQRHKNQRIDRTSRKVGTPPITISTTCHKYSPFSVAFSAAKSEISGSKPSLSVGKTALLPAKSSLPALIWLPPSGSSCVRNPNSCDPKTAAMESILTLWSMTPEDYSTIPRMQRTAWQYAVARGRLSSIWVVMRRIYKMNNCTQWSTVFPMVLRFLLRVENVNTYHRCVDAQEAKAGAQGIDRTTGSGWPDARGGTMARWMSVSHGDCNDYSKPHC